MGISPFVVSLKGMVQGNDEGRVQEPNGPLWSKVLEAQAERRSCQLTKQKGGRSKRARRILMKRRGRDLDGSRRRGYGIERRVRTLKNLIPNSESMGLDGLFRETANYILALQMRVELMQIMVKVLEGSDE